MSMLKMSILPIALFATLPAAAVYSVANGTDGELPVVISVKGAAVSLPTGSDISRLTSGAMAPSRTARPIMSSCPTRLNTP